MSALLLLLNIEKAISFSLKPRIKTFPSAERAYEEYCRYHSGQAAVTSTTEIECWLLPRLSAHRYPSSTTRLYGGTEQELEATTIIINPNEKQISNGAAVVNGHGAILSSTGVDAHSALNGSSLANGHAFTNGHSVTSTTPDSLMKMQDEDVPRPTENGGFSHTAASKAKIAAANKGKTPWNKGRNRSPETKARIAAGVRAKNRERFLQKLKDIGVTEEEYEAKKKEERQIKEAERRSRRTEKGGYRPTEETKAKISRILKEKFAKGEIKPRNVDPSKVRRGFTHTAETRAKISESLKRRWADDEDYRERMKESSMKANSGMDTRNKISTSLKKKWQDPEFRALMLDKFSTRENNIDYGQSHREKISRAMKAKWKDPEYREKTLKSISRRQTQPKRERPAKKVSAKKAKLRKAKGATKKSDGVTMLEPLEPLTEAPKKKKRKVAKRKKAVRILEKGEEATAVAAKPKKKNAAIKKTAARTKQSKPKEPDGSVNRLKEERRDLFDLLYGDEDHDNGPEDGDDYDYDDDEMKPTSAMFSLEDEDLDSFDPYGLDDY